MGNDFTEMARKVSELPSAIEQSVDSELGDVMSDTARAAKRNLTANNSVAKGTLRRHTRHLPNAPLVDVNGYATHVVRAMAPYAAYVEYGTGLRQGSGSPISGAQFKAPSNPPVQQIRMWMIEKGIAPREYDTVYGAAIAIAEDIADYGTRAHPFMRPAWKENRRALSLAHSRGVKRALRRL